jgi:hypothetical protein
VARVEEDPEERISKTSIDDLVEDATSLSDMEGLVPLRDCLEVWRHEPVDIIGYRWIELGAVRHHEARTAVERTPHTPVALLPSPTLQWSPIDANRALATLIDGGISVSLEFRFAGTGEVTGIYTPARWGRFGEGYAQRPWEGHFRGYERRNGVRVPTEGDVGWYVADEWRAVWQGTILEFDVRTPA